MPPRPDSPPICDANLAPRLGYRANGAVGSVGTPTRPSTADVAGSRQSATRSGFRDAYNETEDWVAPISMGLNQAPIMVMIENYRSGLLWRLFMANDEIRSAVHRIGR